MANCRSVDDVQLIIEKAKLHRSDLLPLCQSLVFSNDVSAMGDSARLVQVDDHVISTLLAGNRLVIRGDKNEPAVLCTEDRTYEIREAETSNSLLLMPQLSLACAIATDDGLSVTTRQVSGVFYRYLELRECRPRLRQLQQLLHRQPYRGRHLPATGYSYSQIQQMVQSSSQQLLTDLDNTSTVLIDGLYYGLQFEYEFHVLDLLLRYAEQNSLSLDSYDGAAALKELSLLEPEPVVEACLSRFFCRSSNDGRVFECRQLVIARMFARMLLETVNKFNLPEFVEVWTQSLPNGVCATIQDLYGVAIVNTQCSPHVIVRLLPSDMPESITDRFALLFDIKPAWLLLELEPYFHDVAESRRSLTSLLAKHCRVTTVAGEKHYVSRHLR